MNCIPGAPDLVRLCSRAGNEGLPSGEDGGTEGLSIDTLATDAGRIDVEVSHQSLLLVQESMVDDGCWP